MPDYAELNVIFPLSQAAFAILLGIIRDSA